FCPIRDGSRSRQRSRNARRPMRSATAIAKPAKQTIDNQECQLGHRCFRKLVLDDRPDAALYWTLVQYRKYRSFARQGRKLKSTICATVSAFAFGSSRAKSTKTTSNPFSVGRPSSGSDRM